MKRIFIVILGVLWAGVAAAATKCVKLDESLIWSGDFISGGIEWTAVGRLSGNSTPVVEVRAIAVRGTQISDAGGTSETITISQWGNQCWCRIISPVVSDWVPTTGEALACDGECVCNCVAYFRDNVSGLRTALFNSVTQ